MVNPARGEAVPGKAVSERELKGGIAEPGRSLTEVGLGRVLSDPTGLPPNH